MSDVLGDKDVIARLKAQQFELNKLNVKGYGESYFSTKGVGQHTSIEVLQESEFGVFDRFSSSSCPLFTR